MVRRPGRKGVVRQLQRTGIAPVSRGPMRVVGRCGDRDRLGVRGQGAVPRLGRGRQLTDGADLGAVAPICTDTCTPATDGSGFKGSAARYRTSSSSACGPTSENTSPPPREQPQTAREPAARGQGRPEILRTARPPARPERGPLGEPCSTDFLLVDLPPIAETFAAQFTDLQMLIPGREGYRVVITTGRLVAAGPVVTPVQPCTRASAGS